MKTLIILASIMAVLFHAAPETAQAQKRKSARILEGKIVRYECADNCYLDITDRKGKQHRGLCYAKFCDGWLAWKTMPTKYKGRSVRVTVRKEQQGDGERLWMDAFTKIQFLK